MTGQRSNQLSYGSIYYTGNLRIELSELGGSTRSRTLLFIPRVLETLRYTGSTLPEGSFTMTI